MAAPKATVLCALLYLSVQSHSLAKKIPYVSFMGTTLDNHSYVNLSLVENAGDGSDSVKCHTDLDTCCSDRQGADRGDWYFPTGGRLNFSDGDGDVYEVRTAQSVDLRRRNNGNVSGIYRCNIATNAIRNKSATVYTGLYTSGGDITIADSDGLNFTENSDLNGDSPKFTLTCISTGGPATTVTWTRDSKLVSGGGMTVLDDPVTAQYTHTLTVTGRLGGFYQCTVSNNKPSTAKSSFTVQEASAPGNLTAVQESPTSIYVSWAPPTTLGHTTGYNIYYKNGDVLSNTTIEINKTNHLLSNLMNGASYNISIVGTSEHLYSDYVNIPNLIPLVPGKPTLRIESRNATIISLSWSVPNGSVVVSYTVMWKRDSNSIAECSTTDNGSNITVNGLYSYMITGLEEDRTYVIMLIATNAAGSTPSENVTGSTEEAAPSAPPGSVTPSNETSSSIMIQWSVVECIHRNGDITGYLVRYGSNNSTSVQNVSKADSTKITLSRLNPSSNYSIEVAATNSAGIGPYSSPEYAQTLDEPPVVNVESHTSKTISISWMSTSRDPVGFVVVWKRDTVTGDCRDEDIGNFTVRDGSAKYSIIGLEEASRYSITVRRDNLVSIAVTGMTGEAVPSAPPSNITQTDATPSSVTIQWEAVECIHRNGKITDYEVQLETENGDLRSMSMHGTAIESTISKLESSTTYEIRVAAVNSAGRGVFSSKLNVSTSAPEPEKEDPTRGGGAGGGSNAGGAVAGVIVSLLVVAGIVALGVVGVWLWRKQKSKGKYFPTSHYNISLRQDAVSYSKQMDFVSLDGAPSGSLAPEIEEFPEETSIVEGEAVQFCAKVTGTSQPKLTWYHEGESVVADYSTELADGSSLTILSTEKKHSGAYKLEAENEAGKVEKDVQLLVSEESPEHEPLSSQQPVKFSSVPVAMFGSHVEKKHDNNNEPFVNEFESIGDGEGKSTTISRSIRNRKKNRFANISVYDDNRVILSTIEDRESEYINASYVDGHSVPKKYIASQGPIPITVVDFWRMVWQEKAPSIVMITNLVEGNKAKCEQYWPQSGSLGFGPFQVTITDQQILADYTVRRLNVQLTGSSERAMTVTQFHYTAWPDHGVPDYATPILTFHKRVMREHKPSKGPIIIHCSAGVGRTGTFITIDHILEQVEKEGVVNIPGVIHKLRQQRINMVQTPAQYIFIHDAILESVTCGDTQINAGDLRKKLRSLQEKDQSGQTELDLQFSILDQVSTNPEDAKMFAACSNPAKNRSSEFLPVDQWRVVLKGENPDYINATNIHGYKQQRAFIITQGPMQSTRRDFWKMVCDRKCSVIVMLSDLVEQEEEVCYQYWPRSGFQAFGEITVELMGEEKFEGYLIRTLCLQRAKFGKVHQVYQFQITNWAADGKCSNLKTVTTVIDKMTKVQRRTGNHSITVHCSDTVSRSAVFCGIVTTIERCKTEGVVDVFQVVKAMRVQKPGAVRTVEQYLTIFEALLVFLDSFETYANFLQ